MNKIVVLPLDERPCNYDFPYQLFSTKDLHIVRPMRLGDKKKSADSNEVISFLLKECKDAYALVLSIDTLLYGGLIPSRLHYNTKEEVENRLNVIKQIKKENPLLKIYAFQCIMRCPRYSSSDEEPDYYGEYGEQIHNNGVITHKINLGLNDNKDINDSLYEVKEEYLADYKNRRAFNLSFNVETLKLVQGNFIDFLIIPQDDAAKYGFTAMDQEIVREEIYNMVLQDKVLMYPGADEITLTLLARIVNEMHGKKPKVFVKYASSNAPFLIPSYEDRTLGETIKYHIMASGCKMVTSYSESDLVIALSAPASDMKEAITQPVKNQSYCVERNIIEFIDFIKDCIDDNKPVTIGDNAYANGADLEIIRILNKQGLLLKVAGYAGWNTSSNTIGTALSSGVHYLYYKESKEHLNFLVSRYVEDAGYCAVVRSNITKYKLPAFGMSYFNVGEKDGIVSNMVKHALNEFIQSELSSISNNIQINSVTMPWKRMFEVGLDITYIK